MADDPTTASGFVMSANVVNPVELHDPIAFGYSHTVTVPPGGGLVFVAGQYASDRHGHTVSGDFATQVEQSFANLRLALGAVGVDLGDVVQLRTYIVDHGPDKLDVLVAAVRRIWGDRPPAQTLVGVADLALPDMRFEVDAVAVRPTRD